MSRRVVKGVTSPIERTEYRSIRVLYIQIQLLVLSMSQLRLVDEYHTYMHVDTSTCGDI